MSQFKEFEKYISEGYVLDKNGEWVPIEKAVSEEMDELMHLEQGEVQKNGMWVKPDSAHSQISETSYTVVIGEPEQISAKAQATIITQQESESRSIEQKTVHHSESTGKKADAELPSEDLVNTFKTAETIKTIQEPKPNISSTVVESKEDLLSQKTSQKESKLNNEQSGINKQALKEEKGPGVSEGSGVDQFYKASVKLPFAEPEEIGRTQIYDMGTLGLKTFQDRVAKGEIADIESIKDERFDNLADDTGLDDHGAPPFFDEKPELDHTDSVGKRKFSIVGFMLATIGILSLLGAVALLVFHSYFFNG